MADQIDNPASEDKRPVPKLASKLVPQQDPSHERALTRIKWLERWLENAIAIPGTSHRVGLDALIGLVPVAGDVTTALLSLYMLWEARRFELERKDVGKMLGNIGIDILIGLLPLVGDYADFAWKSNTRNLKIIKAHIEKRKALAPGSAHDPAQESGSNDSTLS